MTEFRFIVPTDDPTGSVRMLAELTAEYGTAALEGAAASCRQEAVSIRQKHGAREAGDERERIDALCSLAASLDAAAERRRGNSPDCPRCNPPPAPPARAAALAKRRKASPDCPTCQPAATAADRRRDGEG